MDKEIEKKLGEEISFYKRETDDETYSEGSNTFQSYGFECGNGWYDLLLSCGKEILACYEKAGKPVNIVIEQIKEKFATLRFYYSYEGEESPIQAFDFLADGTSLRMHPQGEEDDAKIRQDVSKIVKKYEELSATVCETCGKQGTPRMDLRWKQTLCEEHYLQRLKNSR